MRKVDLRETAIVLLVFLSSNVLANGGAVEGVFGLAPIEEGAALAVWVPLGEGESVQGVRWYNNDGQVVFPEVLAVAGEVNWPQMLDDAVVVGEAVSGSSSAWSEFTFPQALASEMSGLYVIFRLPVGGDFEGEGEGGGAGIGYRLGNGDVRCWIAMAEDKWNPVSVDHQMAVDAVMNEEKGGDILVLRRSGDKPGQGAIGNTPPLPTAVTLRVAPNPFNPQTEIAFALPSDCNVDLSVFDVRGRRVRTLVVGRLTAGTHVAIWDGRDVGGRSQSSGIYIARLKAGKVQMTQRLTMVR